LLSYLTEVKLPKLSAFDVADYLDSDEIIAEYLTAALEDADPNVFLLAVANVAKAKGMSNMASQTGLGRESLYKAFAPGAKPRYDTILKVLRALGVRLHAVPVTEDRTKQLKS